MSLYRVTFQTSLLVETSTEDEAYKIGISSLPEEVKNGSSELYNIEIISNVDQLFPEERQSLPWRNFSKINEIELNVNQILESNDRQIEINWSC